MRCIGLSQPRLALSLVLAGALLACAGRTLRAAELPVSVTFSGDPGIYTREQWRRDWPGCRSEDGISEGRVSLVERGGRRWLRTTCRAGQIGPAAGGAGWRWPFGDHEAAELSFRVHFDPDFDFSRGGKLPGFGGGPENITSGRRPDGTNGFSVRVHWRADGRGELYVYHVDQPGMYGERVPFPADFRFARGEDLQVRLALRMNRPSQRDGVVRAWVAMAEQPEQLVVERTDFCWRTVDTFGVDSVYFQAFHGGSDSTWAPRHDCWIESADFRVGAFDARPDAGTQPSSSR